MSGLDYFTLGVLVIAGICAMIGIVRRKKRGKGGCGCCPHKENCGGRPG